MNEDRLIESIDRLATAIKYLADVAGFTADKHNPKDAEGKAIVDLEFVKCESEPEKTPEATLADVKRNLNLLAKGKGKDAALGLLAKYAPSKNPADLQADQYAPLLAEIEAAQ